MLSWYSVLADDIQSVVRDDPFWGEYLSQFAAEKYAPFGLHLAVLVEPYLQFILDGRKTVESRFSARRCAPFECVQKGDIVLLKRSGGPIVGLCQIADTWFYRLDPKSWKTVRKEFTEALCAQDPTFWKERRHASFVTLMRLQQVRSIAPITCAKRDRRGWVILRRPSDQIQLWEAMRPVVLAFAGSIASGKSTLSVSVATALGWPRVSFGDHVREVARNSGLDCSREVLQDVGASLIDKGWEDFCRTVLRQVNWSPGQPLIVDGIRHVEAIDVLRQLVAPSTLLLVLVVLNEPTREARLRERGMTDHGKFHQIEAHSTEAQVKTVLPRMADITVDGARPVEDLVREIVTRVQQYTAAI